MSSSAFFVPRRTELTVAIPPGFNIGTLIGQGGANCKGLKSRHGSAVHVDNQRMEVIISGGDAAAAAAEIRAQIADPSNASVNAQAPPALTSRPGEERVEIPRGFDVRILIGSGGSNCKDIKERHGSSVFVDQTRMVVVIKGGDAAAAAAEIRAQIADPSSAQLLWPGDQTVPIPPGFNLGLLIGQGGANCKDLKSRFRSSVFVDNQRMVVVIKRGDAAAAAAEVRAQIADAQGLAPQPGGGAPRALAIGARLTPQSKSMVLQGSFMRTGAQGSAGGPNSSNPSHRMMALYSGPAVPQIGAGGRALPLFHLARVPATELELEQQLSGAAIMAATAMNSAATEGGVAVAATGATAARWRSDAGPDGPASAAAAARLGSISLQSSYRWGVDLCGPAGAPSALAKIARAAAAAATAWPRYDDVKIRFSLGKQLFYPSKAPASEGFLRDLGSLAALRGARLAQDGDCRATYTDYVADAAAAAAEAHVRGPLGFALFETKTHASVYLQDTGTSRPRRPDGAEAVVVVSLQVMDPENWGAVRVRKIKLATDKPAQATFMGPGDQLDFRLVVTGQHHLQTEPVTSTHAATASAAATTTDLQLDDAGAGADYAEAAAAALVFARAVRYSPDTRTLVLPSEPNPRFHVKGLRVKQKRVYAGTYPPASRRGAGGPALALRFAVTTASGADGAHRTLGGCAPAVQNVLSALRCAGRGRGGLSGSGGPAGPSGAGGPGYDPAAADLVPSLEVVAAFCAEVCEATATAGPGAAGA